MTPFLYFTKPARLVAVAGLLAALALAPALRAADADEPPSLSEDSQTALGKLKPLLDNKSWDAALDVLRPVKAKAGADSYDMAIILDTESKLYLQKGDYASAVPDMVSVLALYETHKNYFDAKSILDTRYLLAEIYGQLGSGVKDKEQQHEYYQKAIDQFEIWYKSTPKLTPDGARFYAGLLYAQATADSEHPDLEKIKKAQEIAHQGTLLSLHPKDDLFVIELAAYQQEGRTKDEAELLEYLLAQNPQNKSNWQQLLGTYMNLANEAETSKNETLARQYNARSVDTLERAQKLGFMTTPKDNYILVSIYYNAGQFGKATDLLDQGLNNGTIEGDLNNWNLLSYSYQQINQDFKAIEVLNRAAEKFPENGQLNYQIGTIYMGQEKTAEAFKEFNTAAEKGHIDKGKEHNLYMLIAYTGFELQKYDEALAAVNKSAEYLAPGKTDTQMTGLKAGIEQSIAERDHEKDEKSKSTTTTSN